MDPNFLGLAVAVVGAGITVLWKTSRWMMKIDTTIAVHSSSIESLQQAIAAAPCGGSCPQLPTRRDIKP